MDAEEDTMSKIDGSVVGFGNTRFSTCYGQISPPVSVALFISQSQ